MGDKLKTLLIGLGAPEQIQLCKKTGMEEEKYILHTRILQSHEDYDFLGIFEQNQNIIDFFKSNFPDIKIFSSIEEVEAIKELDVLVCPYHHNKLASLLGKITPKKGIILPIPTSQNIKTTKELEDICEKNNILAQIDMWRRAEDIFINLASGDIENKIGKPVFARAIYTGDIMHNGVEMVDLLRLLLGEVVDYSLITSKGGAISFMLKFESGISVPVQSLSEGKLKEFSLEIWGKQGCIDVCDAGQYVRFRPRIEHPRSEGYHGICRREYEDISYHQEDATTHLYDNLAAAITQGCELLSPISSHTETQNVIDNVSTLNDEIGFMMNF